MIEALVGLAFGLWCGILVAFLGGHHITAEWLVPTVILTGVTYLFVKADVEATKRRNRR